MSNKKFYAVKNGREKGVFNTWDECKAQVQGFKGAKYKSFIKLEDAEEYAYGKPQDIDTSLMAYVDGSYNNETKTSGYGLAFVVNDEIIYTDKKSFPGHPYNAHRNVFGEIKGAEEAISIAIKKGHKSICIAYDYAGIECWATNEWEANTELTQEYKKNINDFSRYISIYFKKIKAHASESEGGDKFNDFVDKLAKEAVGI